MGTVKESIKEYLQNEQYKEAADLMKANLHGEIPLLSGDPEYCALAASAFLQTGQSEIAFDIITVGLIADNKNYELFLLLGEYYFESNPSKALVCFYQAMYYCSDDNDRAVIDGMIDSALEGGAHVSPVSIVVVKDGNQDFVDRCIDSIKNTVPEFLYRLILVEAGKDYGPGYVIACNEGIRKSEEGSNILLLDYNCVLAENSLFYLMLGLYDNDKVGIVGAVTNNSSTGQSMELDISDFDAARQNAIMVNSPLRNAYEKRAYVSDFAMLIRREVIDQVGMFDEALDPVFLEDRDYGFRAALAGYDNLLCYNSFIFNMGENSLKDKVSDDIVNRNQEFLRAKWRFDVGYSGATRSTLIDMIRQDENTQFNVLEVGCALGSTLSRIKYKYPNSKVWGIEYDRDVVKVAEHVLDIIQGDAETMDIPYEKEQFDYIICADVLEHLRDPEGAIKRFMPYLKQDGHFLVSLPNIRHFGVLMMLLLDGRFDYQDSGILDRTHLKFFTLATAKEMLENCGLEVLQVERNLNCEEGKSDFVRRLEQNFDVKDGDEMMVFQYYFLAKKRS